MDKIAVAPFVGAWIEIYTGGKMTDKEVKSLPSWERGLKLDRSRKKVIDRDVAPFVGAWIEIIV